MKLSLNGKEIHFQVITVNDGLNFNRFFDLETKEYELQLSIQKLKKLIENEYNSVRDEIKKDDELHNETSAFTNTNYCSLTKLLAHESDFFEIMNPYLTITLFQKIFTVSSQNCYVINSIDSIQINNEYIFFKGRVFNQLKF